MKKLLPIGKSTFKTLIEENYLYVDKTQHALTLIQSGTYYFLSRPRRFGKSLFLDTLATIFSGEKELFKGLHIYDKYAFPKHPVINMSFNSGSYSDLAALRQRIYEILKASQEILEVSCDTDLSLAGCFEQLIRKTHQKYQTKVVILIDEYDKPILDNIEKPDIATELRDELKGFYSVIKGADQYIQFVFMTGVSKFSKVSLFSGLNNLEDITLNPRFATICGYTQNDIETTFAAHLEGQDFNKIKTWYNGYKWLGEGVYNPFDILLFISNQFIYENYWFSTGTPTFLLKMLEKNQYFLPDLESITADRSMLDSFDVNHIQFETLMWQTGYLTIERVTENFDSTPKYWLSLPNQEVRLSLLNIIADYLTAIDRPLKVKGQIYEALISLDFEALKNQLTSLYASIPYEHFTHSKMHLYEGYYVSVFYAYLKALGLELIAEDATSKGRIDLTLKLPDATIVIEFKADGATAEDALAQIKAKGYANKYLNNGKPVYAVGIGFDKELRNISSLAYQIVG
ncbi:ATP-binding protein [Thiomicrorhabdus aquaedulcis]|uniref:ATP-binding protein n=1 Tax=Thiomicrorhabdus aquaedulcis TaxID=2211106 RepID=UPI000FD9F620|nr:ATP-binding protein [Thiomicrorhabdus aquaedulcis]